MSAAKFLSADPSGAAIPILIVLIAVSTPSLLITMRSVGPDWRLARCCNSSIHSASCPSNTKWSMQQQG
eukprot:2058425-Amphidinium_carterae.1